MKQTVTETMFIESFDRYNRSNNFSYAARAALFEWFEEYEVGCDEEIELDPIAICCEWSEYESLQACADDHGFADSLGLASMDDQDERDDAIRDYLNDHTVLIEFDGGILITCF